MMSNIKSIGQVAKYKPVSQYGMEELAHQLRDNKPSGGVLFARGHNRPEKDKARQMIIDIFKRSEWDRPLNMMTMPGVGWTFERALLDERQPGWRSHQFSCGTHFTGVECDRAIYFASVTQMPGVETPGRLISQIKKERFPFAELGVKTRYASFFFANIDDMLDHEWENKPDYDGRRIGWDAAWLDFTGPLSIHRMEAISRFYRRFVHDVLIVTALKARWDNQTSAAIQRAGGHSNWLSKRLRGDILHSIEYFDTAPMAQFAVRHAK